MSTIAADPMALMPRGDAVAGPVAAPVAGEGADFALALADVIAAGVAPAAVEDTTAGAVLGTGPAPIRADGAAVAPLKMLEGLGRIVLPPAPGAAQTNVVEGAATTVPPMGGDAALVPAVSGIKSVEVASAAVRALDPVATEGTVAPDRGEEALAPALPPVVTAQPAADGGDVSVEEDEAPVADVAEAVRVAVTEAASAVIAVPLAAAGTVRAEASKQDAAAEAVRLAGAAPLMAQPVKGRKAEVMLPEKGQSQDAVESDGDGEGPKSTKEDKDKSAQSKVAVRVALVTPEVAAKPAPDKRAEPVAPVVDAPRGVDMATAAPPQMQNGPPLTAPPAAAAPLPMDRPGWETALTERIAAELSEDGQQIELDLSPERLGGLKITLEISDGQAQVRFVTETPEAARLIQQNEHRLSESLSRAGLSLGGHESASRDAQQQQGDRSGRGAPRGLDIAFQRSAEPRPGMISGRAGSGLVNLIA